MKLLSPLLTLPLGCNWRFVMNNSSPSWRVSTTLRWMGVFALLLHICRPFQDIYGRLKLSLEKDSFYRVFSLCYWCPSHICFLRNRCGCSTVAVVTPVCICKVPQKLYLETMVYGECTLNRDDKQRHHRTGPRSVSIWVSRDKKSGFYFQCIQEFL